MSSHDLQSSRRIWTEYWRSGRQGCLTEEAPASARNHIANLWCSWFKERRYGAHILDLACGAGDVARIALSVGAGSKLDFVIEGVDLAELEGAVETTAAANGTSMRLQGGVDMTHLPFADRSFDCAVSQFGIEYADLNAASRELARAMKPDGGGLFLVHHKKSAISSAAASRLQAFTQVIGDGAVFERARQTYQAMSAHAAESVVETRLSEFRRSLRRAVDIHATAYAWETNLREILNFLSDLARNPHVYDPHDALRRLNDARDTIAAWDSRLQSQLAAARDESGIEAFAATIGGSGLKPLEIGVVSDPASGAILAWQLVFAASAMA